MITLDEISVEFKNKLILKDFNLTFGNKSKTLITGPSGSGKSTIFKSIMGFDELLSGTILVDNIQLNGENVNMIRQKIFFMCQDFNLGEGLLREIIETVFQFEANKALIFHSNKFFEMCKVFELPYDLLEKQYSSLSGGEKQRVLIILCYLLNRDIWLLDEPTSALDEHLKEKIADFILSQNKTIIVVSHDSVWLNKNIEQIKIGGNT